MASSREADLRLDRASASRTISDLVRREIAAVASSWANSGLESLTVIVGMQLSYYLLQQLQYQGQGGLSVEALKNRKLTIPIFRALSTLTGPVGTR